MKTSKLSHKQSSTTPNIHRPAKKRISERRRDEENQKISENSNNSKIGKPDKMKLRHNRLKTQMNKRIPTAPYFNKNSQSIKRPLSKKTPINNDYTLKLPKKHKANTVSVNKKTQSKYLDLISNKSKLNQNKKNSFRLKKKPYKDMTKKPINSNKISKRTTNSHKLNNNRISNKNYNPVSKSQQKKIEPYLNTNKNLRQTKLKEERKKISELELKNKNQRNKYKFKIVKKKSSPKSELKSVENKLKPKTSHFYNDILFKQYKNSKKKSEKIDIDKKSKVISSSLNKKFNYKEKNQQYPSRTNFNQFNHSNTSSRKYKFREPSERNHSKRRATEIKQFEQELEAIEGTIDSIPSIRKSGLRAKTQMSLSRKIKKFNNFQNDNSNQSDISKKNHNEVQIYYKSPPRRKNVINW